MARYWCWVLVLLLVGFGLFAALRIIAMLTGAETGLAAKPEESNIWISPSFWAALPPG